MSALKGFESIRESTGGSADFPLACAENFPWIGFQNVNWKYTPLHKGKQKREYLLFFYAYANLEKWAGEMSAVIIAILTPDGFRYFVFRSCYTGRQLLLFLISNPNLM